jgi:hypothetical protein
MSNVLATTGIAVVWLADDVEPVVPFGIVKSVSDIELPNGPHENTINSLMS